MNLTLSDKCIGSGEEREWQLSVQRNKKKLLKRQHQLYNII